MNEQLKAIILSLSPHCQDPNILIAWNWKWRSLATMLLSTPIIRSNHFISVYVLPSFFFRRNTIVAFIIIYIIFFNPRKPIWINNTKTILVTFRNSNKPTLAEDVLTLCLMMYFTFGPQPLLEMRLWAEVSRKQDKRLNTVICFYLPSTTYLAWNHLSSCIIAGLISKLLVKR